LDDGPKRATRTSRPCARISLTGTSATRITRSRSFADPGRGRRQRIAGAGEIGGRHRKAGAIAAEHERKLAPVERIGDGAITAAPAMLTAFVALVRDRLGRFHDVGDADGSSRPATANTSPGPSGCRKPRKTGIDP
jgi:hypothetical protein